MKVLALVSGGKDSCYNAMQCVSAGHQLVALGNLKPNSDTEIDSYMYQSVGSPAIKFYAEAMELPLYQKTIKRQPIEIDKDYVPNSDDEVEDLFELIEDARDEIDFQAVSVGAIFSEYQSSRVQNICDRLGLQVLGYLWKREQSALLKEMIDSGLKAIVIKVAALGLEPKKHLGMTIADLYSEMIKLNEKYGLNVCGEGGEYETLTLDCPLFKKKLVIDESEVVNHVDNPIAPVAFLKLSKMHLEPK